MTRLSVIRTNDVAIVAVLEGTWEAGDLRFADTGDDELDANACMALRTHDADYRPKMNAAIEACHPSLLDPPDFDELFPAPPLDAEGHGTVGDGTVEPAGVPFRPRQAPVRRRIDPMLTVALCWGAAACAWVAIVRGLG